MPEPTTASRPAALVSALLRRREVRFVLVGFGNTLLGLAIFAGFHAALRGRAPYLVALTLTYAVGIVLAFASQRRLVFHSDAPLLPALARFTAVQLLMFGLNAVVLALLVEQLGTPVLLGQAISLGVVVVTSYFAHLLFSFRHRDHPL